MINKQKSFKFEVKLPCGFFFNFNTLDQEPTKSGTKEVKKKSPSTLRRNAARKQKFIEEKKKSSFTNKLSENSISFDLCDFEADCKVKLEKLFVIKHNMIPQLDGLHEF